MDFEPKILHNRPDRIPLPFYMTYPGYLGTKPENAIMQDLEYLQQAYPNEVKRYQRRVAEIMDKMDYEGSMIYDEYPDFYSMRRVSESMIKIMQNEERELPEEQKTPEEKWLWLGDMIQVLLCNEIYKRRHGGRRGSISWMN